MPSAPRFSLRDSGWDPLKNMESLPNAISSAPCGRPPRCHRRMIEAMIFRTRTGCPWRDLPDIFGPWKSLSTRRHRWHRLGLWDAVWRWLEPCATGPLRPFDATHIKLHQSATNPVGGQCCQAIGRTKSGLNPKLTALADGQGRARQGRVDPGRRSDGHRTRSARCRQVPFRRGHYRLRPRVENFSQRTKRFRALATRYDKTSRHFLSAIQLVAVPDWVRFRV